MINLRKATLCLLMLTLFFLLNQPAALAQEGCILPTIPEEVDDIETWVALQWDPANPPQVKPEKKAVVKVLGGFPPLHWSVSGTGFSLADVQTTDRTTTLQASPSACGTATVEVIDTYGAHVTGYVRCSAGKWINAGDHVCRPPCKATKGGGGRPWCGYERISCISGNLRYCQVFCPSPCHRNCPPEICIECGPIYYPTQEWICP